MAKAVAIMRREQPPGAAKARSVRDELLTVGRRSADRPDLDKRHSDWARRDNRHHDRQRQPDFGILAGLERELIRERTKAGMAAAKRRGKHVGRPRALTDAQVRRAKAMVKSGGQSISGMADLYRGDRKTIGRALKRAGSAGGSANA
jgi:hypothetical protein